MRLADLARKRAPSAKLAAPDALQVAFFEGQRPNCPAAHSVLNVPADLPMPAAIFRVLRPLVVALACVLIPVSARAQAAPTITLPLAGTIHRDQKIRPTGQQPYWVSRADCLAEDNFYFTVTLANYGGLTLQVWAANGGVDCQPVEQRQGTAAQCWNVYSAAAQVQVTTVKIKATDIVARAIPGMPPPSTAVHDICTSTTTPKGQQLSLMFMFVSSGAQIAPGSTPQIWKDIGYDITAPSPPTNIKASPGETRLHMSWTQNQDSDTFLYQFYCDPPPGSVLPDGGLKPLRILLPAVVSTPSVANKSLIPSGIPASAPNSPEPRAASADSAAASASSGVSTVKAFNIRADATAAL